MEHDVKVMVWAGGTAVVWEGLRPRKGRRKEQMKPGISGISPKARLSVSGCD